MAQFKNATNLHMKKLFVLSLVGTALVFQFCTSAKKTQSAAPATAKVTYATHVQPIVAGSCAPCHMPPQGNKEPLNSYETVKTHVDDIIARIQKNPGEKGFMPLRHPKLSDSTIQTIVQWKADGLLEK